MNPLFLLDPLNIIFSSSDSDEDSDEYNIPLKKKRKYWVRPYYIERGISGSLNVIFNKLKEDPQLFHKYTRMNLVNFEELLSMVGPLFEKEMVIREPLSTSFRLVVTLRYLATGESQTSLAISYKCSQTSIHRIVNETTKAITTALKSVVFPDLTTEYFKNIATGFEDRWNFPNCIGAIDGKHVTIQAPHNSGSEFYNYKKNSSIVLMAICDHNYSFIWCNVGAAGGQSDGGIFRESQFGQRFYEKTLPIPKPRDVTEHFKSVPYVFVADDVFALHENMLKPYTTMQTTAQKIFNYRLSRARRMIENCFGILAAKWRIFKAPIVGDVKLVDDIVQCCVCLHNWLRLKNTNFINSDILSQDTEVSSGSNNLLPLEKLNRNSTTIAKMNRDKFSEYFSGEGRVEWQDSKI